MNSTKNFILKNLLKLRDHNGEINEEALDALIEAFSDELWEMMEFEDQFATRSHERKEGAFNQWASDTLLSINQ